MFSYCQKSKSSTKSKKKLSLSTIRELNKKRKTDILMKVKKNYTLMKKYPQNGQISVVPNLLMNCTNREVDSTLGKVYSKITEQRNCRERKETLNKRLKGLDIK